MTSRYCPRCDKRLQTDYCPSCGSACPPLPSCLKCQHPDHGCTPCPMEIKESRFAVSETSPLTCGCLGVIRSVGVREPKYRDVIEAKGRDGAFHEALVTAPPTPEHRRMRVAVNVGKDGELWDIPVDSGDWRWP